jgi:hypothetical protein
MKKTLIIVIGIFVLLLLVLVAVPPLIDLSIYKARFLPLAEQALGRRMDVGSIRLRIVPSPAIRLSGLTMADNPAFSKEPFFTAEEMQLRLRLGPMLAGRFEVEEFVLEKPAFNLVKKSDGTFNFADIAKKKEDTTKKEKKEAPPTAQEAARVARLVPALLRIEEGAVTLRTQGQKPLQIRGIEVSLKNFSADRPFPYRIALKAPGLKPVSLEGQLLYQENPSTITLKDSSLKAEDIAFAVSGAIADLTGAPKVNLSLANDNFDIKPIVQLLAAAAIVPKDLEAAGPVGLRAALNGPSNNLAAKIQSRIKELKVNDKRAFKGTVAGAVDLTAPLGGDAPIARKAHGNGRLQAKDGELTNVDIIKKIEQITGAIGMSQQERGGATTFETLETDFTLGGGVVDFKRIYLQSPVMEANGGGKMQLEPQTLDLGIEAALAPGVSARLGGGKATAFMKDGQGRVVVPLKITGPAKSPSVNVDNQKLMKKGLGQMLEKGVPKGPGSMFEGLFKRK